MNPSCLYFPGGVNYLLWVSIEGILSLEGVVTMNILHLGSSASYDPSSELHLVVLGVQIVKWARVLQVWVAMIESGADYCRQ